MKHVVPPAEYPPEPPWMNTFRAIEDRITAEVNRYIVARRWMFLWWQLGGLSGYWIGFGTVELVKWLAGIK